MLLEDKTVLIITHRPAALEICDRRILMTEEGERQGDRSESVKERNTI